MFSVPDPATGCGSFTLGISGIPKRDRQNPAARTLPSLEGATAVVELCDVDSVTHGAGGTRSSVPVGRYYRLTIGRDA